MFESCYRHQPCTAGIVGPSAEIISSLQSHESCSITLIDYASSATPKFSSDRPTSRYKLQTFLVSISSAKKLKEILQNLQTSQWWDHMASFLIIDSPTQSDQDCSNKTFQILSTAWKMNLLHAKFICHHESKGLLIYSYNPYIDQAPIPWQLEKTYRIKNKHPWTLLYRSYQDSQEICKDLDFDQTKDLGGYKIRASIQPTSINKSSSKPNLDSVIGPNGILARYIFYTLNSTCKMFTNDSSEKLFNMTIRGYTDINLDAWYQQHDFKISSMTYPHWRSGLASITQHRGNLSQIEKLLRVIDQSSRYAVVIVCFVTFVFFKFFLRQSVTSAILTIVRLICNSSVPNVPNNVAARIYLSGLFLFVVTVQAIYQGQLASLLTKPVALPNVETFEDPENYKYTIHGHKRLTLYFEKLNYSGRVVPLNAFNCTQYVLRDNAAACVNERRYLVYTANKFDLHLSDTMIQMFVAYLIREDWPLENRLNTLISRLVESNIVENAFMNDLELILRKQKFYEKEKENHGFTVIVLKDLAFAFAILGIGLAGATVVFFIKVWKGRK